MKLKCLCALAFLAIFICGCSTSVNKIVFYTSHEPNKKEAPFSDVVAYNGLLFLSGQVGMDHTTRQLVSGGITEETLQCLENIKAVLAHHQSSLDKVIKCTVILKDIEDFEAFNAVYKQYFPNKPARTTFAAGGLAVNARIEIDVIAAN